MKNNKGKSQKVNRRRFLKSAGGTTLAFGAGLKISEHKAMASGGYSTLAGWTSCWGG